MKSLDDFIYQSDGLQWRHVAIVADCNHELWLEQQPALVFHLLMCDAPMQAGGKLTVSFAEAAPLAAPFDSLASFSSKGPTMDGRVKPDLLAPGTLQSAFTDGSNTCSLRWSSRKALCTLC